MDEPDKIKILLSEYTSLSNQIISRFAGQCQLYSIIAAVTIGLLGVYFADFISGCSLLGLLVLTALFLAWLWLDIDRDIAKAALRIREIEARINVSAGEQLLEWETKWGRGGVIGKHLFRKPFSNAGSHEKRSEGE